MAIRKPQHAIEVEREKRDPYVKITGYGRHGYYVEIIDESDIWSGPSRGFSWGLERAERWGARALKRYLAKRNHEDFRKTIYG